VFIQSRISIGTWKQSRKEEREEEEKREKEKRAPVNLFFSRSRNIARFSLRGVKYKSAMREPS
jgi:hypothetical protein